MKHIIILGDGMADWKIESLGNKTPLQYAYTPNMDKLAAMGRTGMLKTVPDGFHPGSEVANSAILGYDQRKVYEGRGPLEAASIGVKLDDDDFALRCNLICVENEKNKEPFRRSSRDRRRRCAYKISSKETRKRQHPFLYRHTVSSSARYQRRQQTYRMRAAARRTRQTVHAFARESHGTRGRENGKVT